MKSIRLFFLSFFFAGMVLFSEEECLENRANEFNEELRDLRESLKNAYDLAARLHEEKASLEEFEKLVEEIKNLKKEIEMQENLWKLASVKEEEEGHAYWDMGEATLSQLIMEYGSSDYLYVIPQELAPLKIHLYSTIPIPRESWEEMIELILQHHGIGIKKLSPFLRQLYLIKQDLTNIEGIATSLDDVTHLPDHALIFYVFSSTADQARSIHAFFERFADSKQATVQTVGNKVILVAPKNMIEKLIHIYEAVWGREQEKIVRVVVLQHVSSQDVEKILKGYFQDLLQRNRPPFLNVATDELLIFSLPQSASIVLIGSKAQIDKAEKMIKEIEEQFVEGEEITIYWYRCKHSDPEELATILERVYSSLSYAMVDDETIKKKATVDLSLASKRESEERTPPRSSEMPVSPSFVEPGKIDRKKEAAEASHFIIDPKTGSILMVLKKEELSKVKTLLTKLDVPKKMVQIDVLLVEKRLIDHTQSGINLLKIGNAKGIRESGISFDTHYGSPRKGLLDFILSRPKGHFPAFDLMASFLMAQEDIHINANPSVLAVNQTPAQISIVEELSINNGAILLDSRASASVEKSYTRAQFGITIVMTPTIHLADSIEEKGYITLQTNVNFDTTKSSEEDRPPVTRRHIENEVCVADGETIILGGLKRISTEDSREKIPFLGDIPGIGKLFGTTKTNDSTTEMFIFITPHIIHDPIEDLRLLQTEALKRRPGDIPEFLNCLQEAKKSEKKHCFESSRKLLLE